MWSFRRLPHIILIPVSTLFCMAPALGQTPEWQLRAPYHASPVGEHAWADSENAWPVDQHVWSYREARTRDMPSLEHDAPSARAYGLEPPQPTFYPVSENEDSLHEVATVPQDRIDWMPGAALTEYERDVPNRVLAAFVGYDAWRGYPDGAWTNNGIHTGINYGTRLGKFSEWSGIGMQIGGSLGVYDWGGTDYRVANQDKPTTQGFLTYGLFRNGTPESRWNASLVHDWMINNNYSVMGEDSTLGQLRAQLGYALGDWDAFGVWGAWRVRSDTRTVGFFGPVTWRPINQLNAYWHHKWGEYGPDTWISVGVPERDRLAGEGSLGDYIAGVLAVCPLSDRVSLYSMVNYMHQSAAPGPAAAKEEAWNFYTGILIYPQPIARAATIFGRRWAPRLPVANNGLFLVDASRTY